MEDDEEMDNGDSKKDKALSESLLELLFCQPCGVGDKQVEVYGYCRDCEEYLCEECFMYHTKLTICSHHILLGKANMPRNKSCKSARDRCIQRCDRHEDEVVKYFCPTHAQLGCSACMVLDHRRCDGVEYIPAVSKDFTEGKEYEDFNSKIEYIMHLAKHIIHNAQENVARSARFYSQAMRNVNILRQEITEALDQLETDMKEKTERLAADDNNRLKAISSKCENVLEELSEIVKHFQDLRKSKQYSQLFIYLKRTTNNVSNLEMKLKAIENKTVVKYNFQPSKEMKYILKTPDKLGKLFKWDFTEAGANHVKDICVKTRSDKNTCCITGSVMMPDDQLIIADRINDKAKLVDVEQGKVIAEMELPCSPWDIAALDESRFAVTLPRDKTILVVKCDRGNLVTDREINVGSECWGIAFSNGKLVVTHENPGSVDIIDMAGSVVQRFSKDGEGHELFKRPSYAAITDDLQTIYVADWDANSVTSLDFDGKVKQVYKDGDLEYPGKLVIDQSGVVTVCGINSSNVHLISSDCTRIQIFSNTTELDHPRTLSYSADNDKLYVGMWENDNIRVYQLS